MKDMRITPEMIALIPDLAAWGDAEIGIEGWLSHVGNYQLAIRVQPDFLATYSQVWRLHFAGAQRLRGVCCDLGEGDKRQQGGGRSMLNHLHMVDLHGANPGAVSNEAQLIELGRILKEIYQAKLAHLFPDLRFEVEFDDTPGLDPVEYQVTFWRIGG